MEQRESNQGYEILERFTVGELGYALGESRIAPAPFVTWCYRADNPRHFFWGHYVSTRRAAYEDYQKRIRDEMLSVFGRIGASLPLPERCLTVEPSSGDLILIKRGERGFYPSNWNHSGDADYNRRTADVMNERWRVTKAQEAAMLAGSISGWSIPAADLNRYSESGLLSLSSNRSEPER